MTNRQKTPRIGLTIAATLFIASVSTAVFAQTAPPPTLGQDTKGVPAIEETATKTSNTSENKASVAENQDSASKQNSTSLLGSATIKESRRENGQVYLIELEHSSGCLLYTSPSPRD